MGYHGSKTEESQRDLFRTPKPIFNWLNSLFNFSVDAACTKESILCNRGFYYPQRNAFEYGWYKDCKRIGIAPHFFVNPPYSDILPWVEKAEEEASKGCLVVMLVPSPNGDKWTKMAFEYASDLILINGRVSFIGQDGKPASGNNRGSCVYVFRKGKTTIAPNLSMVDRDWIYQNYGEENGN